MNRQEQLAFCKVCQHQKFDLQQGIICSLTNAVADFQEECTSYAEDTVLKEKEEQLAITRESVGKLASQGKRFTNYIIDFIFIMVFSFMIGVVLALISPEMLEAIENGGRLLDYVFGFVVGMIYYSVFEMITGRTIGKLITGTKVVDEQGNKPDANAILVRSLCRYIPLEALSFLGDGPGWHDTMSKTRVVDA